MSCYHPAIRRTEAAFGEPFAALLARLRRNGLRWQEVADFFGVSSALLLQWRKALHLEVDGSRRNRRGRRCRADEQAQALGYEDAAEAVVHLRRAGLTVAEVAEYLHVGYRTVTRHYPRGFAGQVFVQTEKYRAARRKGQGRWSQ